MSANNHVVLRLFERINMQEAFSRFDNGNFNFTTYLSKYGYCTRLNLGIEPTLNNENCRKQGGCSFVRDLRPSFVSLSYKWIKFIDTYFSTTPGNFLTSYSH